MHNTTDAPGGVDTPLLTPDQAGAYLRTHPRTLANWRVRGEGPTFCRIGRRPFYRLAELNAYIEGRQFSHRAAEQSRARGKG